ncbi:DUF2958 domain-containing protein [Aggregatilinea lenta]|uniref:DUF2958 domain-containing protein n=1 Tax=Aggregatilinea lenta TaxID=913108 RepID=UPI001EE7C788|nr:DUF2958 domain-containing protein [Aggregatilinea lenta]
MAWFKKEEPTPFDELPLAGLFFLDGDVLAKLWGRDWTAGEKYPMIAFPSGEEFELWASGNPEKGGIVHIFGEMDLPFRSTRDEAFRQANHVGEQCGYITRQIGENQLEVWGNDDDEHFLITYNNEASEIQDINKVKPEQSAPRPRIPLFPDEIRAQLPPLYSGEEQGLEAKALVKFFTPDSNWTWYASEFDGEDRFFGLMSGFEVELGYFSLSELESVKGPLGLPIERDKFFEPTSLRQLQEQHRRDHLR